MPYHIGPHEFRTKKQIAVHLQMLFDKYATVGVVVSDPIDHHFLAALLGRHPEYEIKAGCGVESFSRDEHPIFHSPGFKLHRVDGSYTDFSTARCINGRAPSLAAQFREACRYAVDDILRDYKCLEFEKGGGRAQAPDGEWISKDECWHEHVTPSWKELVDGFLAEEGHTVSAGDVSAPRDNQYYPTLESESLVRRFREYYVRHRNLVARRIERRR